MIYNLKAFEETDALVFLKIHETFTSNEELNAVYKKGDVTERYYSFTVAGYEFTIISNFNNGQASFKVYSKNFNMQQFPAKKLDEITALAFKIDTDEYKEIYPKGSGKKPFHTFFPGFVSTLVMTLKPSNTEDTNE